MKESVLKIFVLFSSLHCLVSQAPPSAYLPYELVQWAIEIESLITTGFPEPKLYSLGDAQCRSSGLYNDHIVEEISPKLRNIRKELQEKHRIYFKRLAEIRYMIRQRKYRIDDKMDRVRQAFEGLIERIPTDHRSLYKEVLCSYALKQLTGDSLKNEIDSMRADIIDPGTPGSNTFSGIVAELAPPYSARCNLTYTNSEIVYSIYSELMSIEIEGYITMVFSYWYLYKHNGTHGCRYPFPKNADQIVTELRNTFKQTMIRYAERFLPALKNVFDSQRPCFPKVPKRDMNFIELEGAIQAVALPAGAGGSCSDLDMHGVDWTKYCEPYPNNHICLGIERPCLGHISRCEHRTPHEVRLDPWPSSRLYDWIIFQEIAFIIAMDYYLKDLRSMRWKDRANCVCLCVDNAPDSMSTHIFNLQPVEADVTENKVVTGVRVLVDHRVVHLQIKQGILGRDWRVEGSTWKKVNDISEEIYAHRIGKKIRGKIPELKEHEDYQIVSYGQRFNIDLLRVPHNHVLTGVKFHSGFDQNLQIAILTREFDRETGKLTISNRARIIVGPLALREDYYGGWYPFKNMDNYRDYEIAGRGFVVFTETWWHADSGQTTVPFFDPRPVESDPATAMGGFGFSLRVGSDQGFGLLSPQLYSLVYESYLKESLNRLKK